MGGRRAAAGSRTGQGAAQGPRSGLGEEGPGAAGRLRGGGRQGPSRHFLGVETKPHSGCREGRGGAPSERWSGRAVPARAGRGSRPVRAARGGREGAAAATRSYRKIGGSG